MVLFIVVNVRVYFRTDRKKRFCFIGNQAEQGEDYG